MKRFTKAISYFLIAVFFSIALSGCGKTEDASPSASQLIVWSFEEADVWAPIAKQFAKENEGVTLVYQKQTFDSTYENRVLNSLLSGDGPDIWAMPNDWVYRHKDKLVPRPTTTPLDINTFVPAVKQSVEFDKKIYALTPSAEPLIVFYNQSLFNKTINSINNNENTTNTQRQTADKLLGNGVPTTWTDFTLAVQLLTQKDGENITESGAAIGTDQLSYSQDLLYLLMLQNSTKITADDLQLAMFNLPATTPKSTTDTPGKLAMDFYTSFTDPGSPNYSWNASLGNEVDAFANGKVAMIFGYDNLQNTLAQKYPNFGYRKGSVPQLSTNPADFIDYAKFNAFGVSNLSSHADIAWIVIDSICAGDYSGEFNSATRLYNSRKALNYEITLENRNTGNPEKNSLATAKALIKGRYPVDFDNIIKSAIFAVNHGIQGSQDALDLAANNITDNYFRKSGW
ncbi:hypothetical protein COT78_00080 [Candidatus Berkelbacteria bacterium CG10_big_fil_rev_8_21_14_0_10_43_13]|uniref:ABC transporter substrate-binding protein n=1 Tax=Candidatus Berkelbacteria bacterium CG10_big_fil_rev_8_21_14_0_10_43_13 TaxID=1974514 RepID=A0A2H0W7L8_9BACT|nr:MAG: hypothetical protein COT78_00080 [Candidatus Berkelbacteria bacterium CG10_big_fil_rev_8_21_14_0_10_43_13]